VGESTALPDGREVRHLEGLHLWAYQSVFGFFEIEHTVYGSREGKKVEYVPVDTQLQLPENDFSYLLQVERACRHFSMRMGVGSPSWPIVLRGKPNVYIRIENSSNRSICQRESRCP